VDTHLEPGVKQQAMALPVGGKPALFVNGQRKEARYPKVGLRVAV
jgi:hypothetical protein